MTKKFNRRDFIIFLTGTAAGLNIIGSMSGCNKEPVLKPVFKPVIPSDTDDLLLAKGLDYEVLVKWKETINKDEDYFGFNNDYTAFLPGDKANEAFLWVNHEYPNPLFIHGYTGGYKNKSQVDQERYACGGSILAIKRDKNGRWRLDKESAYNRRITGETPIALESPRPLNGRKMAVGTMDNCAGGVTPWGSVLSCEENYHGYYGEWDAKGKKIKSSHWRWDDVYNLSPWHYGWVVEIDIKTGSAVKLTAMGRFAHEGATPRLAIDGRVVVYMGDDSVNQFIYKFISKKRRSLKEGELFVANTKEGKWLSLSYDKNPLLQKEFKDQLDVLIHCRKAGKLLGATPQDRPEDIEINPHNGDVLVCLTNNILQGNFFGKMMKIKEEGGNPLSKTFSVEDFSMGGRGGYACPDNIAFDKKGNLWMTTDMSGKMMNKPPYDSFKNNGLFYMPLSGTNVGRPIQVASAPVDAEMTGISFSSDYKTLFLSVQHPGEQSKSLAQLTSHWPSGGSSIPEPAVVQIYGETLDRLMS